MKLIFFFLLLPVFAVAQPGFISTIAGTGVQGFSGDGGLATHAQLSNPYGIAFDIYGNQYIADEQNSRVRKIDANTGIITTVAGNGGSGNGGDGGLAINANFDWIVGINVDAAGNLYIANWFNRIRKVDAVTGIVTTVAGGGSSGLGDGGPATSAVISSYPEQVAIDGYGNLFITDGGRIRKVDAATGIISTVAGNGTSGFSGDGGLAVNASLNAKGVCIDGMGNLYISDFGNNRIRKVNATTGIITTVVGGGTTLGDGGLAINAQLASPRKIIIDSYGNLYISDYNHNRIRKVTAATGIITTVAGNGVMGYSGDGGTAVNAQLYSPAGVALDISGNLYITDGGNNRVRKVEGLGTPTAVADSFSVYVNPLCSGPVFTIVPTHYSTSLNVKTWFGDGQTSTDTVSNYTGNVVFAHNYAYPGVYTVKHILYNGTTKLDSISYAYTYHLCRTLPLRLYFDGNSNCIFDTSAEGLINHTTMVEVDSNSIAIDTITSMAGFNYNATGNIGDVYKFTILSTVPGLIPACPSTGIVIDTLISGINITKYIGFQCSGTPSFDLAEYVNTQTHANMQKGHIIVNNNYCTMRI